MTNEQNKASIQERDIVSRVEWITARKKLLAKEKAFTRTRDQLSAERRRLPWVKVEKNYIFNTSVGKKSLAELFWGRSQLVIYHFMFGPDWEEGCESCSFWADNFDRIIVHLNHRDVTMVAVSRGPLDRLLAFRRRMGWSFDWASSLGSDFNFDFHVSFTPEAVAANQVDYNYGPANYGEETPGVSVFYRDEQGHVYHTYSCYARGIDALNTAYQYLDLVPKGRDEDHFEISMEWVRHRDRYENNECTDEPVDTDKPSQPRGATASSGACGCRPVEAHA